MEASLQTQSSRSTYLFMSTSFSSSCLCLRRRHRQSKAFKRLHALLLEISRHTKTEACSWKLTAFEGSLFSVPPAAGDVCNDLDIQWVHRGYLSTESRAQQMKRGAHIPRKRLINWQADISEFIIIKQTSFCSPTTILANPSSQATYLRDLSYKYSPNQNKWLKALRELKAIHIYIRGTDAI